MNTLNKEKPKLSDYRYVGCELVTSAIVGIVVKYISLTIPIFFYLWVRQLVLYGTVKVTTRTTISSVYSKVKSLGTGMQKLTVIAIVVRSVNLILAYWVFSMMPISAFSALESPLTLVISLLLGITLLGERFSIKYFISVILIITGTMLITGYSETKIPLLYIAILLINGVMLGVSSICNEKLSSQLNINEIMVITTVGPVVPLTISLFVIPGTLTFAWVQDMTWLVVALIPIGFALTFFNNKTIIQSNAKIGATRTTVLRSFTVVFSIIFGITFLQESMNYIQLAGVVVSITGVVLFTTAKAKVKAKGRGQDVQHIDNNINNNNSIGPSLKEI